MKKHFFSIFATAGVLLCVLSCSKQDLTEELQTAEGPETTMATAGTTSSTFFYGVNGHPLGVPAYLSVSPKTQIDLLKKMNMNMYRIDVQSQLANGYMTVPHLYKPLKEAADAAGITILPMLYPRDMDLSLSESESYKRGRVLGDRFARRYADDFTYYNIANELDLKCLISGSSYSGASTKHYDQKKFKIIAAYLKGMDEGIKSKDPTAKTIVNVTWMHFQFLLMLERAGVNFDIVGYNWYNEMENLALQNHNISDITEFLASKFTKPIWFMEVGVRNATGTVPDATQKAFLDSFIAKCRKNPRVQAAMVYELFDEPQKSGIEANYGIFKWASPYTEYAAKLFAQ